MKKLLSLFLIIMAFTTIAFISLDKVSFANEPVYPDINGRLIVKEDTNPFNSPRDISFIGHNVLILDQNALSESQIVKYDISESLDHSATGPNEVINLNIIGIQHIAVFNGDYFYASETEVYLYANESPVLIGNNFTKILDLVVSSKSLFLIEKNSEQTLIYKFNEATFQFESYAPFNGIRKFMYSEIAKKTFILTGQKVEIIEEPAFSYTATDIVELICDFEGNLYVIQETKITKFNYADGYKIIDAVVYDIEFPELGSEKNPIIAAAFNYVTGDFGILCKISGYNTNYNVYIVRKNQLKSKTSIDIPNISELNNIPIFNLSTKIDDFYVAKISEYPSNMLYPAGIYLNGTLHPTENIEIALNEKVIVFKKSGIYSYVLYQGEIKTGSETKRISKIAVVYNNSLQKVDESEPEFTNAKILLNRSKVYLYPSNFVFKNDNSFYDFKTGEVNKNDEVSIESEIDINGVTYCHIKYGDNKTGYINKAELSEDFNIRTYEPTPGKIDCNGKVPLYKDNDALSEKLTMLSHKQPIEILKSGNDLCYIKVALENGETLYGYVESKFVLVDGLTNLQKMGLWIFLSTVALAVIAIILRKFVIKKRKLS